MADVKLFCTKCRREISKPDKRGNYVCPHCLTDHVAMTNLFGDKVLMLVLPVHIVETSHMAIELVE